MWYTRLLICYKKTNVLCSLLGAKFQFFCRYYSFPYYKSVNKIHLAKFLDQGNKEVGLCYLAMWALLFWVSKSAKGIEGEGASPGLPSCGMIYLWVRAKSPKASRPRSSVKSLISVSADIKARYLIHTNVQYWRAGRGRGGAGSYRDPKTQKEVTSERNWKLQPQTLSGPWKFSSASYRVFCFCVCFWF